ncbi:hypothetical protein Lal_00048070 [Lupinus albus]|nr:hypothetical protein Lal_00048070 [Lupinus albus]
MDNKNHQSQTFLTTNTNSSKGSDITNNAPPPCYKNGPYLRQLNKHSNKISKPISKILPNNTPNTKNHLDDYENMFTQLNLPPLVYTIKKSEFKEFVQKVTGCTLKATAQPPLLKKPNPPNTRCIRRQPPPLNTTFRGPTNPINHINPNNNNVVATPSMFPQASSFPSVRVGAESPITPYMSFFNDTVMSSPIPLMYPSTLFPHGQVGFHQLVPRNPSPRWNDVQI